MTNNHAHDVSDVKAAGLNVPKAKILNSKFINPNELRITCYYNKTQVPELKKVMTNKKIARQLLAVAGGLLNKWVGAAYAVLNVISDQRAKNFLSNMNLAIKKHKGLEIRYDLFVDTRNVSNEHFKFR